MVFLFVLHNRAYEEIYSNARAAIVPGATYASIVRCGLESGQYVVPRNTPEGREAEIMEKALGWSGQIFKANPKGCPKCGGSGYKGRVGIHELMVSNEELIQGINKELEAAELKKIAMRGGMKTLHQDSMLKVKEGLTTIEEAIANVPPDM